MSSPFALEVDGFGDRVRVLSFDGQEALSKSYRFRVIARVDDATLDLERGWLGCRAALFVELVPGEVRAFHGLISSIQVVGRREQASCDYAIDLVPRMWLLKKRRRTRIFQNQRVVDIVASVLGEAGIASRWQLLRSYPIREYCTQYEETDYRFVTRLLAEAGIFFHFHQGGPQASAALAAAATSAMQAVGLPGLGAAMGPLVAGDSVICGDDATFYPALGDSDSAKDAVISALAAAAPLAGDAAGAAGAVIKAVASAAGGEAPVLHFVRTEDTSESLVDKVTAFSLASAVKPTAANFREYDPERPLTAFSSHAISNTPFSDAALDALLSAAKGAAEAAGVGEAAGQAASAAVGLVAHGADAPHYLEVYDHHAPMLFPKWTQPSDEAPRLLRQERRRASVARGVSGCPDLAPGHRFALSGHPLARLDQTYAVTRVTHRGRDEHADKGAERVYQCDFECVPAEVTFAPKKPKRESVQVCLTAIVVGPEGSEIHVDNKGQIKVQFHWDREGSHDDGSSCWIRTMQPWAGAHWGVQFIPRVGMEVVVMFEGGDPDKPIVLGAVTNATHPPTFKLPESKTISGFRTATSPGGNGYNELSFDDAAGQERIILRAQHDLDEVVQHNHSRLVENDQQLKVAGNKHELVEHKLALTVKGDREEQVLGNQLETVSGNSEQRVAGMATVRVEGKLMHATRGDVDVAAEADVTLRSLGSVTTVVGKRDKPRSWVTHAEGTASLTGLKRLELHSDEELVLSVGKSSIRITKDKIELDSSAITVKGGGAGLTASDDGLALSSKGDGQLLVDKKLVIKTQGASMALEKEVKIDGSQILLNSPEKAKDPPPAEPEPPTTIVLKDEDGAPLGEQRYVITFDDKSQQSGMVGPDGTAELSLKQGGDIVFPQLKMRGDVPKGAVLPYVVRQGDYLEQLAFRYAFDAEEVWNDGKNAELKQKRKDPNQLAPGDVLHFARSEKKPYPLHKGTSNEYRASVPKIKTTLHFSDALQPFANEPYVVEGLAQPVEGSADAQGTVIIESPIHVREVRIVFPKRHQSYSIRIGDVDPIEETSGVRARLEHLGYLPSGQDAMSEASSDQRLVTAIKEFQRDHGLEPTGEIDDALRAELVKAHGS